MNLIRRIVITLRFVIIKVIWFEVKVMFLYDIVFVIVEDEIFDEFILNVD